MLFKFFKYEGTGNDFVIIDNRDLNFDKKNKQLVIDICDRKKGVGSDGLILLENHNSLNFKMIYYNADGSESGFCGNGSRCITHLAKDLELIAQNAVFQAIDGEHISKINNGLISVKMNDVSISNIINYDDNYKTTFIDSGSPHLIMLCSEIDNLNIVDKARQLKTAFSEFKNGININFCEIKNDKIKLRTYERGVEDETLSCGTGAVATAIFLRHHNLFQQKHLPILMKGGELSVELHKNSNTYSDIWLSGEVNKVFVGTFNSAR
ncbi:MAG: diaminopimelate epimerase [Flavobacteriaceae bacterium]